MRAFLDSLSETERAELGAVQETRLFQGGEVLFQQGEQADGAYVIRSGQVELQLSVPGGAPVVVGKVGEGEMLGEPALLQEATRTLSARAVDEVETGFIHRQDFQGLRHSFRSVSFRLIRGVAQMAARRIHASDSATSRAMGGPEQGMSAPSRPLDGPAPDFDPRRFLPLFPFFQEFVPADLDAFVSRCSLHTVTRGREIVRLGERSERCWVVVRGAVEARNPLGRRVGLFGPGSAFGLLSPLLGTPANADCIVREDGVLLEVAPETFQALTQPTSRVAFKFTNAMALSLLRAMSRANRVLARAELERRTT